MTIDALPPHVAEKYLHKEVHHASAILERAFPEQWADILSVLTEFRLYRSEVEAPGGGRSPVALRLDRAFEVLGWEPHVFETSITVDDSTREKPTHKVDNVKGRIAVEPEWNNKGQAIVVTHNPNLAVVCDADQVIVARMDKGTSNTISYEAGAIENPTILREVVNILEGTQPAFLNRSVKYSLHMYGNLQSALENIASA